MRATLTPSGITPGTGVAITTDEPRGVADHEDVLTPVGDAYTRTVTFSNDTVRAAEEHMSEADRQIRAIVTKAASKTKKKLKENPPVKDIEVQTWELPFKNGKKMFVVRNPNTFQVKSHITKDVKETTKEEVLPTGICSLEISGGELRDICVNLKPQALVATPLI